VSDSADGKTPAILAIDPDLVDLLKEEYFHLQKTVEDFDQRALTIKAWSVTTSIAGIAASFLHKDVAVLSLLAALASLSFWMTEALWKEFQQCYYPRIRDIETAFSTGDTTARPFKINRSWSQTYHPKSGSWVIAPTVRIGAFDGDEHNSFDAFASPGG
jgi:hypothetical protein